MGIRPSILMQPKIAMRIGIEQAAKSAKNYLDTMPFSKSELIHQLEFDGYSKEEAEYGAQAAGY